jgi:hypothetical protein
MFELAFAWVTKGNPFLPLHMIAGIPLRRPPMAIDLGTALPVGMVAHMLYSMTAGVIVAFLLASVPWLRSSGAATIVFPGAE